MKHFKKLGFMTVMVLLFGLVLSACSTEGNGENEVNSGGSSDTITASDQGSSTEEVLFIPIISKGFQHQFWQAVKQGAEKAADELGVEVTFEGPESESQVDKQLEMLQAALDKIQKR